MDKHKQLIENVRDLVELKKINSIRLFLISSRMFALSCRRGLFLLFFYAVFMYIQLNILFSESNAITIIADLSATLNAITIPIFAVIITGYAIFQALTNDSAMLTLLTVKHKNKESKFGVYNLYFYGISCWYLILIIINFICYIIFKYLPKEWESPLFTSEVNEIISGLLISFYVTLIMNFLIEMKSFIYNLFQVFITSATTNSIDFLKKNNEDIED